MHFYVFSHFGVVLFYTKMLCTGCGSRQCRSKSDIAENAELKTLQFLCHSINSAHDDQFCVKFSTCRLTEFWHSLQIYDDTHIPRRHRRKQKWVLLIETLRRLKDGLEDAHSDVVNWRRTDHRAGN